MSLALAAPAAASPAWARADDKADASGHTFTCEGAGASEDDALAAALGICNDKICKVCGVEVESVVETKETLTGVEFSRKVVERCRRLRGPAEGKPKFKSSDCGPSGCTAWVQLFFSKEQETQECPGYGKESFEDPAACEKDVDAFRSVTGRSAASLHERVRHLDDALVHCEKIDVRPTPAILALDARLTAGLDSFEFTRAHEDAVVERGERMGLGGSDPFKSRREEALDRYRPLWAFYLPGSREVRQQVAETKLLTGRIQLLRDLVQARALAIDVLEAAEAKDFATTAGLTRLLAALEKDPPGAPYGAPDVHFAMVRSLADAAERGDLTDLALLERVGAYFRATYPAEREREHAWDLAILFAGDGRVTADEWTWGLTALKSNGCLLCMRSLLAAPDHGGPDAREARLLEALASAPPRKGTKDDESGLYRTFREFAPDRSPGFLVAVEAKLPPPVRQHLDWEFWERVVERFSPEQSEAEQQAALRRASQALLASDPDCEQLEHKLDKLAKAGADLGPLGGLICACLDGTAKEAAAAPAGFGPRRPRRPLSQARRLDKRELLDRAIDLRLACTQAGT